VGPTKPSDDEDLAKILGRIKLIGDRPATGCKVSGGYCNGLGHYRETESERHPVYLGRCFMVAWREERDRLDPLIRRANSSTIDSYQTGFDGYDPRRHPRAAEALRAMQNFSGARPPKRGVLLSGGTGLGKTRLLLASHLALVRGGVDSRFVTAHELSDLFRRAESFDEDVASPARQTLTRLCASQVLHVDDLGDIHGDERRRGFFQAGLKGMLDQGRFVWAVATNCTLEEAVKHPELGEKIISRLADGVFKLALEGVDQRTVPRARTPKGKP
jgi:DNA replication protein DnaC